MQILHFDPKSCAASLYQRLSATLLLHRVENASSVKKFVKHREGTVPTSTQLLYLVNEVVEPVLNLLKELLEVSVQRVLTVVWKLELHI